MPDRPGNLEAADHPRAGGSVLDYPYLVDVYAVGVPRGVKVMSSNFNGMEELLTRPDAAQCLQDYIGSRHSHNLKYQAEECLLKMVKTGA